MVPALAAALAAALAGATEVRFEAGLRGEARALGLAPEGEDAVGRAAAELTPRAAMVVDSPRLFTRIGWSARLYAPDLAVDVEPSVTHQADLRLEARPRSPVVLGVSASAARGRTDPLADLWSEVGRTDPTAVPATPVPFEAARAAVDASWEPTRRDVLTATASAAATQGTTAAAQLVLPPQRSIYGEAAYGRRASPRDLARLSVLASGTRTDPGLDAAWLIGSAEWRRQLTRDVEGFASGGASLTFEESPEEPAVRDVAPVAAAGLAHVHAPLHAEELTVRSTPSVHRLGGEIQQVLSAAASARWSPRPRWTLTASFVAALAWLGPYQRVAGLDVRAAWRPHERFALEAGVLARWQDDPVTGRPPFFEGGAFLAFTVDAPPF